MDIGIIGLGAMGREMAKNLAAAGHTVKAWSRLGGEVAGVNVVDTPEQALGCVFNMVIGITMHNAHAR